MHTSIVAQYNSILCLWGVVQCNAIRTCTRKYDLGNRTTYLDTLETSQQNDPCAHRPTTAPPPQAPPHHAHCVHAPSRRFFARGAVGGGLREDEEEDDENDEERDEAMLVPFEPLSLSFSLSLAGGT